MIKIVDGNRTLNCNSKKCDRLINKAKSVSDTSLLHFFDLIGLDSSLFKHLTEINIVIDLDSENKYENVFAYYENVNALNSEFDNTIRILSKYIYSVLNSDNYNIVFDDLVKTIIHETIHANRCAIIDGGVLYPHSFLTPSKKYISYSDNYFAQINEKNNIFNVVKIRKFEKISNIIVYNKQTNNFAMYTVSNEYINNMKSCAEVEELINSKLYLFRLVKSIVNPFDRDKSALVLNYSTIFTKPSDISRSDIQNISLEIEKQRGFEECLTECFARIIYYLKDKDEFNFDELLSRKDNTPDILLAYHFIKSLDMDTIRWFFLSCYEEEYTNRFYKLYQDNYYKIIDKLNEAYEYSTKFLDYPHVKEDIEFIRSLKK